MYEHLDRFFDLPAIVVGIKHRVWLCAESEAMRCVHRKWIDLGLIDADGQLTTDGLEVVDCGMALAVYYINVLPIMLKTSQVDESYSISREDYAMLRQGLADYHKLRIAPHFWPSLGFTENDGGKLIDVCGGAGLYSLDWVKKGLSRSAVVVDRPGVQLKFEDADVTLVNADVFEDKAWSDACVDGGRAATVLLSEILHCKSGVERSWLVDLCTERLVRQGGSIVVNERHPNAVFDWRMSMLTKHGKSLDEREIAELMIGKGYGQVAGWNNAYYHATRWSRSP